MFSDLGRKLITSIVGSVMVFLALLYLAIRFMARMYASGIEMEGDRFLELTILSIMMFLVILTLFLGGRARKCEQNKNNMI